MIKKYVEFIVWKHHTHKFERVLFISGLKYTYTTNGDLTDAWYTFYYIAYNKKDEHKIKTLASLKYVTMVKYFEEKYIPFRILNEL